MVQKNWVFFPYDSYKHPSTWAFFTWFQDDSPSLNFGNGMQWPHLVNGHLARVLARVYARPGPWFQQVPAGSAPSFSHWAASLPLAFNSCRRQGTQGLPGTQCHPHHIRRTTSGSLSPSSQGIPGSFDTTTPHFLEMALLAVNPRPLPGAVLGHGLGEGHAACALFPVLVGALAHGLAIRHQGERLGVWPRRFRTSKSGSAPLTSAGKQHHNNRYPLVIKRGWLENPLSSIIFPLNPP